MQAKTVDAQFSQVVEHWNFLRHPFYLAWVAGTLTRAELRDYAAQYAHVVAAIPTWLESTAAQNPGQQEILSAHAREESEHVELWRSFSEALGLSRSELAQTPPNRATAELLRYCTATVESGNGAAVVWALEAQSPAVSAEKLSGLAAHYDMDAQSGAQYFALHAELDKDHESQLRSFIAAQGTAKTGDAVTAAEATSSKLWDLLTSVQA